MTWAIRAGCLQLALVSNIDPVDFFGIQKLIILFIEELVQFFHAKVLTAMLNKLLLESFSRHSVIILTKHIVIEVFNHCVKDNLVILYLLFKELKVDISVSRV